MNCKFKILVDAHVFDKSFQGTTTYLKGLYNSLVENNCFEITLCANNIDNLKLHFTDKRFKFIKLKFHNKLVRLFYEFPLIIKKGGFDYAHFQYITPPIKMCKYIVTVHDVLFMDFKEYFPLSYRIKNYFLFKYSSKISEIVLTVSEYSRNRICNHFNLFNKKVFVIPNAIEVNYKKVEFNVKKKYGIDKYILFVSRFEPRKNHIGLLNAFIDLGLFKKGFHLVLIGSSTAKIEIKALEDFKKMIPFEFRNMIKFINKVSYEELFSFYKNSECFVYPSFAEGFGIPPIEAAYNDSKVLCSRSTSMIDFDFFKYTFDPNNQVDFNKSLENILIDNEYPFDEIKTSIRDKYNWANNSNILSNIIINSDI